MAEKWKKEVESIVEKASVDLLKNAFREKLQLGEIESLPEEWRKAFEDIFRKIAYNFSVLECMGRAFRMGQAWQLYQDELKRTENHGPEETHMV